MRCTFKVLFYIKRNAKRKNGLVPVMCRITVNGKQVQFSCKVEVDERLWSVKLGRMSGRSTVAQETNNRLERIRVGIDKAYQELLEKDGYVSAEKVRNAYLGIGMNHKTLLAVFRRYKDDYERQIGTTKSERSYAKYNTVYNHLTEFILQRYKVQDIALKELTPAFITDFEIFLRVEKGNRTNTIWTYMMPLKSIIHMAINNGWLSRDPFFAYKIKKEDTHRGFLTDEELTLLINGAFKKKYELVRDLFLFCCFTGLSYTDMKHLTTSNIESISDGILRIVTKRRKTLVECDIPLLDTARHIIEKYKGMASDNRVLPVPCYANCKNGIKVVAKACGINKDVTWHMSRHTYATTICLSNDVPIETLSKMLGHRSIRTTQIYAKITGEKICRDMDKLSKRIASFEHYICQTI